MERNGQDRVQLTVLELSLKSVDIYGNILANPASGGQILDILHPIFHYVWGVIQSI